MDEDSKKQEILKNFFKKLLKKPSKKYAEKEFYGYDDNGNLVVTDKDKNVISTIELEYYRGYSKDELEELEKEIDSIWFSFNTCFLFLILDGLLILLFFSC